MKDYINFDRQNIGQTSLNEALSCLRKLGNDKHYWKYTIISIHNALQCYLSIALRGVSGVDTWKKLHAKKWLQAYDESLASEGLKQLTNPQLDYFMKLYDKLFYNKLESQRGLINWLNDTRNEFIHFNSDSYSVHEPSLFEAFSQALEDIKLLPSLSQGIFFHYEQQKAMFDATTEKLSCELEKLNKALNETP